jgi:DNA-binding XRE family transcriptional regulator
MDKTVIGEILKRLRTEKGVNQDDIASLLNIKRQTYSAYERNVSTPDPHTLGVLADYFGVPVGYLIGRNDTATNLTGVSGGNSVVNNSHNSGTMTITNGENNNTRVLSKEEQVLLRVYDLLDIEQRHEMIGYVLQKEREFLKGKA